MTGAPSPAAAATCGMLTIPPLVLGSLLSRLRAAEKELQATRALLANPNLKPVQKVVAYNALSLAGAAPGRPATQRAAEWSDVTLGLIAHRSGIKKGQTSKHVTSFVQGGLLRKKQSRSFGEDGTPRTHTKLAPPDGQDWVKTWDDPWQIMAIAPTVVMEKDKDREQRKRTAIKRLLAEGCPHCGCTDLDQLQLRCKQCGTITEVAALADASRDDIPAEDTAYWEDDTEDATSTMACDEDEEEGVPDDEAEPNTKFVPLGKEDYSFNESSVEDNKGTNFVVGGEGDDEAAGGAAAAQEGAARPAEDVALASAIAVLAPAVCSFDNHLVMLARQSERQPKYITRHEPLTPTLIAAHLLGRETLGAGLYWSDPCDPGGRKARCIAWDTDDCLPALIRGAARLARAGLRPLLVKNPSKAASGHLWLLLDEAIDPTLALAAAEKIAPELAAIAERFPNPHKSDGARLRLPGGLYLPVASKPAPVQVAVAPGYGPRDWSDGTTPHGWAVIASAVSHAAILQATYIPPQARPELKQARRRPRAGARAKPRHNTASSDGDDIFARFNAAHPVESLVMLEHSGMFKAPWRDERTASVKLYEDGHWHDFGPDGRHGLDAFDLWCALEGHWNAATNRPDRKAALAALRPQGGPGG